MAPPNITFTKSGRKTTLVCNDCGTDRVYTDVVPERINYWIDNHDCTKNVRP